MGRGVDEGKAPEQPSNKYLSKGLTRSRTDNLVVMRGGEPRGEHPGGGSRVTSLASHGQARAADAIEGAVALKQESQHELSPTERLEALQWSKAGSAKEHAQPSKAERRAEAKAKGYEGEMCGECGHFSLVRNGTCMKCDTCGSTTGCS
jgi:ribonucleoside-diphosphate reductase alpha chain